MGEYFCQVCKFYDVGGRENLFHCSKCGSCYSMGLQDNHLCVENATKNCCPISYEYLFDSIKGTAVMRCGHTIHMECYNEMLIQKQYRCPICSKSSIDMSRHWERLDEEIGATAMPNEYRYEVLILCNDCSNTSTVNSTYLGTSATTAIHKILV